MEPGWGRVDSSLNGCVMKGRHSARTRGRERSNWGSNGGAEGRTQQGGGAGRVHGAAGRRSGGAPTGWDTWALGASVGRAGRAGALLDWRSVVLQALDNKSANEEGSSHGAGAQSKRVPAGGPRERRAGWQQGMGRRPPAAAGAAAAAATDCGCTMLHHAMRAGRAAAAHAMMLSSALSWGKSASAAMATTKNGREAAARGSSGG